MDVDGVLTDGGIIVCDDGSELRKFHVHDGAWLRIWRRLGLKTAVITGKQSAAVEHRLKQLEIDYIYQNAIVKLDTFEILLKESNVPQENIAYVGDDLMDLPVMRRVGFCAAVADAAPQVRQEAEYITQTPGGKGAVRELIEYLIKRMGLMDAAMERYMV